MEVLLAILIVLLALGGLSLGLILRGRPPETACEGMCRLGTQCATCPHRKETEA